MGVAGWVVQHGELLNVGDVRLDTRYADPYSDGPVGHTTRTMLCVPLRVERRVIGSLCVTHSQPNALNQEAERLLTSFAEQAAVAVHKTRLLEERTRQGEELARRGELISSLMSIRQAMVSSLKLSQVLHTTISRISELIHFDHGANSSAPSAHGRGGSGRPEWERGGPGERLTLRPGTLAMALWEQARPGGIALACSDERCMMIVPLVNRGKMLGCILLARHAGQPFQEMECDIAEQLAGAATVAVDNARLFSSLAQQQQQTAALYRLILKVSDAPNRRQLAHVVCQEIQQITGARATALLIHDAEQGHFTGWAASGEWADRREVPSVALAAHGDPFVSNILALLQQRDTPELVVIHDVPAQGRPVFGGAPSVTLPLTLAGRIYGLLILQPGSDPAIPDDLQRDGQPGRVALHRGPGTDRTVRADPGRGPPIGDAAQHRPAKSRCRSIRRRWSRRRPTGSLMALPDRLLRGLYPRRRRAMLLRREGRPWPRGQESGWQAGPPRIACWKRTRSRWKCSTRRAWSPATST